MRIKNVSHSQLLNYYFSPLKTVLYDIVSGPHPAVVHSHCPMHPRGRGITLWSLLHWAILHLQVCQFLFYSVHSNSISLDRKGITSYWPYLLTFSAIYENQFYYLFGFLFLVLVILAVSCSQISVVMVYFQVRILYVISLHARCSLSL